MTLPYQNSASVPVDHEWVKIGPDLYEYRGFFISKSSSGRDWTVLEPAPSKEVFGCFETTWDAEEAIDAFCDRGIVPEIDEIPNQGASERMAAAAREED